MSILMMGDLYVEQLENENARLKRALAEAVVVGKLPTEKSGRWLNVTLAARKPGQVLVMIDGKSLPKQGKSNAEKWRATS